MGFMAVTIAIAASLVVAVLAFLLGRSVGLAKGRANTELELRSVREELNDAQQRLAVSESRNVAYGEAEKILKDTFTALAGSALNQNSEQFLKRAEERFKNLQADTTTELDKRKVAIENLIAPLDQSLKSLDSKVAELEAKRIEAYTEVRTQISELGNVNKELRNQTGSLVQALRSPNVRGSWGQMQLRRAVEMAGMLGHCDFFEQISEATESGRLTPDMIVTLPGDRRVVVDAKAPRMYLEALADRPDAERSLYLKDHAAKVRAHMTLLSGKKYWEQFTPTPEFVVMFLPVEALFAAALQEDPELLEYAVDRKVIPASPLTLIALLRAVNYGWKQESLAQDAEKIRELGKDLYHAVRVLASHLSKMRNNLEDTVENFNASVGSVERSFLSKARKLAELNAAGDEPIQLLEPIDERLRGLEAVELRADLSDTPMLEGLILEPTDQEP
jgi:DNA recombination protein RmuC